MDNNRREFMNGQASLIASIIVFFVLLFVYSKWGPSIPVSLLTQTKGDPMVVTDTGKVAVVPDIVKVSLGIEAQGTNLKQVQADVNAKSKALTDSLKRLGIKENDIKTTNYSVYPEYNYDQRPFSINGYRVSVGYEVKIVDFEVVNEVLTTATSAGANIVGNISFEVNEETKEEYTQKAREEAVKLAKEKAEGLAKASGITLGKIINVTESTGVDFPRPIMYDKAITLESSAPETANVTPGETEISVTVSLSYEVR